MENESILLMNSSQSDSLALGVILVHVLLFAGFLLYILVEYLYDLYKRFRNGSWKD